MDFKELDITPDGRSSACAFLSGLIPNLKAFHSDLFWDLYNICEMKRGEIGFIFTRDCGSLFIDKRTREPLKKIMDWSDCLKNAYIFQIVSPQELMVDHTELGVGVAYEILAEMIEDQKYK